VTASLLNYKIDGRGPHVVLLHPVGLDLTFWDDVVALLSDRFRILRVDLRGHGRSPPAVSGARLEDHAQDVHAVIAHEKFGPAAIVGLSFGGMVTQTVGLDHPEDTSALVICGCPCTLPPQGREMMTGRAVAAEKDGMAPVVDATLERWFTKPFIESGKAEPTRRRLLSDDPLGWAGGWRAIAALDTAPHLSRIKVPALCIAGELDPAAPPAALAEIAKRIPGAMHMVLPGAPHMMQIETPKLFAEAVGGFLSQIR
jgi:3-oxoadipate enol-lactonase